MKMPNIFDFESGDEVLLPYHVTNKEGDHHGLWNEILRVTTFRMSVRFTCIIEELTDLSHYAVQTEGKPTEINLLVQSGFQEKISKVDLKSSLSVIFKNTSKT